MFKLLHTDGRARRGSYLTPHGAIQTPVFMNVGTRAAIKGGLDSADLENIGCQIELSNAYHLHLRPGEDIIKKLGGLHGFMNWDKPVLTDSGGFQVFSLATLRKITEEGVAFSSHIDGKSIFMGPEDSIRIQSALGSDIAMAFDECIHNPSEYEYVRQSCERTFRWLVRCVDELKKIKSEGGAVNPGQVLWGINQGSIYDDLRIENMKAISALDLPGYAIGGLAVGETAQEMYHIIDIVEPFMPGDRPRYLMGVGTPGNIIEAVWRGIDFFDCVLPARNARHGHLYTRSGRINLNNRKYSEDPLPIDPDCGCPVCRTHSRAYIRHLLAAEEVLGLRLCVMHNLWFYNNLMAEIRTAIEENRFDDYRNKWSERLERRI